MISMWERNSANWYLDVQEVCVAMLGCPRNQEIKKSEIRNQKSKKSVYRYLGVQIIQIIRLSAELMQGIRQVMRPTLCIKAFDLSLAGGH